MPAETFTRSTEHDAMQMGRDISIGIYPNVTLNAADLDCIVCTLEPQAWSHDAIVITGGESVIDGAQTPDATHNDGQSSL